VDAEAGFFTPLRNTMSTRCGRGTIRVFRLSRAILLMGLRGESGATNTVFALLK